MILLDTSAIYALAADGDQDHSRAVLRMERAIADGEDLLVHSYIISEVANLLQRRLGLTAVLAFLRQLDQFVVHWLDEEDHSDAVGLLVRRNRRGLSLVDCASFVVMRRYGVTQALAFDADFEREGFALYGS